MHTVNYEVPQPGFSVGYWHPVWKNGGGWHEVFNVKSQYEAMRLINYLNGGNGYPFDFVPRGTHGYSSESNEKIGRSW